MSEEARKHLKPGGTRSGILYGFCKVHAKCFKGCLPSRPNLSALQTPACKLAMYLVPILEPLTNSKHTIKDSLNFATEIVEEDSGNFMRSLYINPIFTNIALEEIIELALTIFLKTATLLMVRKNVNSKILYL